MKKIIYAAVALAVFGLAGSCSEEEQQYYTNPVIQCDLADPSVIRVGESYYATGSSYLWAPEYPLYVSDDLINWKQIGNVFEKKPDWTGTGFWAPELFEYEGKYYCFFSASRLTDGKHCIGAAVADTPEGPYRDLGCILDTGTEQIDSYVFNDDGTLYLCWKAHGLDKCPDEICCVKLGKDCVSIVGEEFTLVRDDESIGMEGPCMFKRDGWYYLLYSTHSCCGPLSDYEVWVARAKSIEGPWEKCPANPVLTGGNADVKSLGHGSVVTTPDGRLFYLCHAYLTEESFFLGRRPFLSELEASDGGWIRCTAGSDATLVHPVPFRGTVQNVSDEFREDFTDGTLDCSWAHPIEDGDIAVLCQRPFCENYTVTAEVKGSDSAEKGLIFFGSHTDYVALSVMTSSPDGTRTVAVKSMCDGVAEVIKDWPLPAEAGLTLSAAVSASLNVVFHWSSADAEGSFEMPETLARLMRWDSAFRPGIYASEGKAEDSFTEFTINAL